MAMDIPFKPKKPQQIGVKVYQEDIEDRELLKAHGVDVGELYRRAIREAHRQAKDKIKVS